MELAFIPEPKQVERREGTFIAPGAGTIGLSHAAWRPPAEALRKIFPGYEVHGLAPPLRDTITFRHDEELPPEGYTLDIKPAGIAIDAHDPEGARHAVCTLRQIMQQTRNGGLPTLFIRDWPDFPVRGVTYDVARGRVPKLEQLLSLGTTLASYKVNQVHLYMEHTFRFRAHPLIGEHADPLTSDDLTAIDTVWASHGVTFVPALATFGHMAKILNLPPYRALAEDWCEGRYAAPEAEDVPKQYLRKGWTLSPANEDTYPFVNALISEIAPLVRGDFFNICCDETWDLGLGQSYLLAEARGRGQVYLDHVMRVAQMVRSLGKRAMFWSDIIRLYPGLMDEVPDDLIVLDWGYDADHDFDGIGAFTEAGLTAYACPGTSAWVSLFPRIHEAAANIRGYANAGLAHGAQGLLTTDWGDGGHYNFLELSWYSFLYGAERAWNAGANHATFPSRFAKLFLGCDDPVCAEAIVDLGDVAQTHLKGYYQSIWAHILFAPVGDKLFSDFAERASVAELGEISWKYTRLDAAYALETSDLLDGAEKVLAKTIAKASDPHGVLPYWSFALRCMQVAAQKLRVLGPGGKNTAPARRQVAREMRKLVEEFQDLWYARNRKSEIEEAIAKFERGMEGLG